MLHRPHFLMILLGRRLYPFAMPSVRIQSVSPAAAASLPAYILMSTGTVPCSILLRSHEPSMFSELMDAGYYVWMNTRNDLVAGQIPGLVESHATEIYYGEDLPKSPGPENKAFRGLPGDKNYYSHYEGRLALDENGKHYSADDGIVDAAIERILHPVE